MDLAAGSERLDPGIDLNLSPDLFLPIDIGLDQPSNLLKARRFKDAKDMGTAFGRPEGDQLA